MRTEANNLDEINALLLEAEREAATTDVRYTAEEVFTELYAELEVMMRSKKNA